MVSRVRAPAMQPVSLARRSLMLIVCAGALAAGNADAQPSAPYPAKPIRLLIGFAPGGNTDVAARIVAKKVSEILGQPLVIENRPGAGGALAGEAGATAAPDGYTLLVGTLSTQVLNVGLLAKPRFDVEKDFVPLAVTNESQVYFGVPTSLGAATLKDFVEKARQQPGKFSYGAPSAGGVGHLAAVMFNRKAGIQSQAIVYKGSGAAVLDLAGGRIEYLIDGMATLAPLVATGKVVVLAVSGKRRHPAWPQIPTFEEVGFAELSRLLTWNAWFAPARTPQPIVTKLHKALEQALADPEVVKSLQSTANDVPPPMSPSQITGFLADERRRWLPLMKEAGVKPE